MVKCVQEVGTAVLRLIVQDGGTIMLGEGDLQVASMKIGSGRR